MMTETHIVATRDLGGVRLTGYAQGDAIVAQTVLEPRRAMLLGIDLVNLAAEPFFQAALKDPAPECPGAGQPTDGCNPSV